MTGSSQGSKQMGHSESSGATSEPSLVAGAGSEEPPPPPPREAMESKLGSLTSRS